MYVLAGKELKRTERLLCKRSFIFTFLQLSDQLSKLNINIFFFLVESNNNNLSVSGLRLER